MFIGGELPLVFTAFHSFLMLSLRSQAFFYTKQSANPSVFCAASHCSRDDEDVARGSWRRKVGFEEAIGQDLPSVEGDLEKTNLSNKAVAKFNLPSLPTATVGYPRLDDNQMQSHSRGLH